MQFTDEEINEMYDPSQAEHWVDLTADQQQTIGEVASDVTELALKFKRATNDDSPFSRKALETLKQIVIYAVAANAPAPDPGDHS